MNILFLTLSKFDNLEDGSLYNDLVNELATRGNKVFIASPSERREGLNTQLLKSKGIIILKIKTGNITKTKSFIEKGISTILLEYQYLTAIKKHFKDVKFDLVLYSTPPITFNKVIKYIKRKYGARSYLMLKDIFPQNAVDIELIKENGLIHKFFRRKEIELYNISDKIGCMSQGNIDYLLKHNQYIDKKKVELFPNAIKPKPFEQRKSKNIELLNKYNIPHDSVLFIYGGNLGKPQGPKFIKEVIDNFYKVENGHLLIVGSGTEYEFLKNAAINSISENVNVISGLPKDEYDKLLKQADVGLIFLDHRFTIPNIPSRLLSYMENGIPILAATDYNTDLKVILKNSNSGLWCESLDVNIFIDKSNELARSLERRKDIGFNGRKHLENYYEISQNIEKLITN